METESANTQEALQPDSLNANEIPGPEVQPAPSTESPVTPPSAKKKGAAGKILLALFIVLLLGGIGYLGYRGYTHYNELKAAQAQLADIQEKHNKLKSENEDLSQQLSQTKDKTATTVKDTETAQKDLADLKDKAKKIEANLKEARPYSEILYSIFVQRENVLVIGLRVIINTDDEKLADLYSAYLKSHSDKELVAFLDYLFQQVSTKLE